MTKEEEKYTTLDTEQCKWWVNTLFGMAKEKACNSHNFDDGEEIQSAQDKIIKALEQNEVLQKENEDFRNYIDKANHTNSRLIQLIEKHKMNRDTSEDCVSREKVHYMITGGKYANEDYEQFIDRLVKELENMPPVTPTQYIAEVRFSKEDLREICNERIEIECTHGTCKDCTNYVVGALDEEICLRGHELIYKDFYCADFEKRGDEK